MDIDRNKKRTTLAKITPPNCPNPSLMTQFSVAAMGRASDCPIPMAQSKDCIDNTPPAEDRTLEREREGQRDTGKEGSRSRKED